MEPETDRDLPDWLPAESADDVDADSAAPTAAPPTIEPTGRATTPPATTPPATMPAPQPPARREPTPSEPTPSTPSTAPAKPATPEPSAEVRYVKKEPNAIGRWFLRNLFSLLVTLLAAVLIVSNLATPDYAAPLPAPGTLSLKYILLGVSGQTWVFLTIMFVAGFLAGVFFLRRRKVREKSDKKK